MRLNELLIIVALFILLLTNHWWKCSTMQLTHTLGHLWHLDDQLSLDLMSTDVTGWHCVDSICVWGGKTLLALFHRQGARCLFLYTLTILNQKRLRFSNRIWFQHQNAAVLEPRTGDVRDLMAELVSPWQQLKQLKLLLWLPINKTTILRGIFEGYCWKQLE